MPSLDLLPSLAGCVAIVIEAIQPAVLSPLQSLHGDAIDDRGDADRRYKSCRVRWFLPVVSLDSDMCAATEVSLTAARSNALRTLLASVHCSRPLSRIVDATPFNEVRPHLVNFCPRQCQGRCLMTNHCILHFMRKIA